MAKKNKPTPSTAEGISTLQPSEALSTAEGTSTERSDFNQAVETFKEKVVELKEKNYIPAFVYTSQIDYNSNQRKVVTALNKQSECCGNSASVGADILVNRYRTPVAVPSCGHPERGYIKTGSNNMLYIQIQKIAQSLPYMQSTLRFITNLLCGGGSELRYRYTTVDQYGKPTTQSCRWEEAEAMLRAKIASLRTEVKDSTPQPLNPSTAEGTQPSAALSTAEGISTLQPTSYRTKPTPKAEVDYSTRTYDNIGSPEAELQQAIEDLRTWERCNAEWQHLKDNSSDLDVLLQQWADDHAYFALSHLHLTFEKGLPGQWGETEKTAAGLRLKKRPKIIGVNYLPTTCCRMEQMSDELLVENIYYAEKFRYEGTIKDQLRDIVAYPSAMPQKRMKMMERIILNNQKVTPNERPSAVLPIYIPSFDSPYYPMAPWWSVFSSMLATLASTIVKDAVTERNNASMFSYLIYLNMTWFDKYCADNGYETDEEKNNAKHEYLRKISDFLKSKENNGRLAALESITSADEKNILKSVEIVEVPHKNSKASLEDMELVGNAIFFAFGVHGAIVGSFGKNSSSSSGTQQRELTLLKSCQLMPDQRLYLNAWDFILRWNDFDPHAYMAIKQYDLSTLDASKTGIIERE